MPYASTSLKKMSGGGGSSTSVVNDTDFKQHALD